MEFEEKVKRVKEILESLNNNELSLKDGMELYKEGIEALKEAQKMLEEAKVQYEEIKDSTIATNAEANTNAKENDEDSSNTI